MIGQICFDQRLPVIIDRSNMKYEKDGYDENDEFGTFGDGGI